MRPRLTRLSILAVMSVLFLLQLLPAAAQNAPFRVYLTFEDGPTDAYTPQILDILAANGAKATFLIGGEEIAGHEYLLQREVAEGHAIVNHLWVEPGVYAGAPDEAVVESYLRTEDAIREALTPTPELLARYDAQIKMFWQPGGGAKPLPEIEGVQAITYNWNVNSDDCGWAMPPSVNLDTMEFDHAVIENVLGTPVSTGQFHNPYNAYDYGDGVVIAFHDLNRVTVRVLPVILSELRDAGASFEALPRPWDQPGTMPIRLGAAPVDGAGIEGVTVHGAAYANSNLRDEPRLGAAIVATLPVETPLTAVGRTNGWIQVAWEASSAWISADLIALKGAIPNLPKRDAAQ
ncbi:MAG: polysaccharide deacetylase family protein [Chloroflexi bacterium]|nr:polysaccharide deacetylase family protein [Chloroflexota bacterium]